MFQINFPAGMTQGSARLLAIVSVLPEKQVQCLQPGCGHGIYAAIHLVEDDNQILVLGSTCFAKRYGNLKALGNPAYSAGTGCTLGDAAREALIHNTAALVEGLKTQHEMAMANAHAKLEAIKERMARARPSRHPMFAAPLSSHRAQAPAHPWPWQHRSFSSLGVLRSNAGQVWVRVQHQNGTHKLAPFPPFEGWDTVLPSSVGVPDPELGAYSVANIVTAMQDLRGLGFSAPEVSRWPDVLKLMPSIAATTA